LFSVADKNFYNSMSTAFTVVVVWWLKFYL
jgi:hypothetical protein